MHLALQQVVGEVAHLADVVEEVADAALHEVGRHLAVTLRQGLEGIGIQGVVEGEHLAVEAFPGVGLMLLGRRLQRQRQRGADDQATKCPWQFHGKCKHCDTSWIYVVWRAGHTEAAKYTFRKRPRGTPSNVSHPSTTP